MTIVWRGFVRAVLKEMIFATNETIAVPCPADGSSTVRWYDRIAELAQTFAQQGFTHILFPHQS